MRNIKIKLNPYANENVFIIDNNPISKTGRLSGLFYQPFLNWAYKLFDIALSETNDTYSLEVSAEKFEKLFLRDLGKDNNYCNAIEFIDYPIDISADERLKTAMEIAEKYPDTTLPDKEKIPVFCDVPFSFEKEHFVLSDLDKAELIITDKAETVERYKTVNYAESSIVLFVSPNNAVDYLNNGKYLWSISSDRVDEVVEAYLNRFVNIPFLSSLIRSIEENPNITDEDKRLARTLKEIDTVVKIEPVSSLDAGKSICLSYSLIPKDAPAPTISLRSTKPNVLTAEGMTISAVSPGISEVRAYKNNEAEPFDSFKIMVPNNNYVKEIVIRADIEQMRIGQCQTLNISLVPDTAADQDSVLISSSNDNIINVNGNVLTACRAGFSDITVKTTHAEKTIKLEVLPEMSAITLSQNEISLIVAKSTELIATPVPNNCYSNIIDIKADKTGIVEITENSNGHYQLTAKRVGHCTLVCSARDVNCSSRCEVTVESSFNQPKNRHTFLSFTLVCFLAAIICLFIPLYGGVLLSTGLCVITGIIAIAKNKSDIFWAILLMGISIAISVFVCINNF